MCISALASPGNLQNRHLLRVQGWAARQDSTVGVVKRNGLRQRLRDPSRALKPDQPAQFISLLSCAWRHRARRHTSRTDPRGPHETERTAESGSWPIAPGATRHQVRLGIEADRRIPIHREEIYGKMKHRSLEPSEPRPKT